MSLPPETRNKGGGLMLHCFRGRVVAMPGAQNKSIHILITILSSNASNGFTSFKINVLKQRLLLLLLALLCISLSLSLSFSSSAPSMNCVLIIHLMYRQTDIFHIITRSIKHGCTHGCHGSEQYLLANTS